MIETQDTSTPGARRGGPKTDMVGKALHMLTALGEFPGGASASQLARSTGHPLSTAHRLLQSLVRDAFAEFDPETRRYRLGLRIFQLGQQTSYAQGFAGSAQPVIRRVTEATAEATVVAILDGARQMTVAKVDGPPPFRVTSDPGSHGALHSTAIGKALVAFAAKDSEALIEELDLVRFTDRTITDRAALRREIERVRELGYATQDEENEDGMRALAVPVRSGSGVAVAALGVAAPAFRVSMEGLIAHLDLFRAAADELGSRLPLRA
ncbi:IclR family transcriptional regulator [Nocardioides insulae]|uniref:IclR family transcriptional regulator n=1 Tax=Nocardioides insulae TaxID=394734 RepID=UPI001B7F8295|nr:IclR family transcriptional regulator [Nocardioides insulae]